MSGLGIPVQLVHTLFSSYCPILQRARQLLVCLLKALKPVAQPQFLPSVLLPLVPAAGVVLQVLRPALGW
jgi:hypothetical protein